LPVFNCTYICGSLLLYGCVNVFLKICFGLKEVDGGAVAALLDPGVVLVCAGKDILHFILFIYYILYRYYTKPNNICLFLISERQRSCGPW
jgi:hypothetical protein